MVITKEGDRRKGNRRQRNRRKDDVKTIKIEGEGGKGQEVAVRHETVPERKEMSTWRWHEEFTVAWSETFISRKTKENPKKGE